MRPGVAGVAERGHLTHTQRKTGPWGRQSVRRSLRVVAAVSIVWPVLVALTAAPAHAQADTTPPTLGATAGGVTTFGRVIGTDVHLYFSEAIDQDPGRLPVPDAFFIKVDGVSWSIRPGSVRGGADQNELVLGDLSAPIVRGQTVSVAYVDSTLGDDAAAIQDLDGNDAEPFNFVTIDNGEENTTGRKPIMAFVSVERPHDRPLVLHWALVPTSYGADSYDVQYARTSERPVPEAAWFDGPQDLTFTGAVHAYAGEGTATFENLDSATYYSMRVRGTNSHGAGDWAGPVGAWTNYFWPGRATPVTRSARVLDGGTDLIMPFDRNLDRRAGRTPPKELFEVTAGGAPVTIGEFLIRDNEPRNVYLTGLSPAIRRGQTVTVSYRDPTPIDGTAVLQGTNGADVHSFSNARVKNRSLLVASDPGVGPAPASARVDADGDTVIVSFDEDVDGSSIPGGDAFAVTVGGTGVTVSGAGSGDRAKDVHIEIAGAIEPDRTVTVSYTRPTSGNAIQDAGGNDAESFAGYPVASAQARQSAPPEPLTAAFEDLPGFHDGSTAFTVRLAFAEEFPVMEEAIRAGLTVSGGALGAVAQTESGKNRRWDIAVTPSSSAEAVSIALTPKESCGAEGAICTEDGRGLPETVEAEVPGREPTQVVSATVISGPGENGAWDTGETVVVGVRFSREVSLSGPANVKPAIGIALDGTRRDAGYASGSGSDTLRFEYAVAAADDGAARARVVANSLNLNGYVIGDGEGYEAELGFSVAPELSVADAGGTEGTDGAIAFTVTLAPAAATEVTVHYATADGSATAPADYTSTSSTLTFEPGQTSRTVEVPIVDDELGVYCAALEPHACPERDAGDQCLAIVDAALNDHLHADHEERRHQHDQIGRDDRARYREDRGAHLGQERHGDEHRTGRDADAARRGAGQVGHRHAGRQQRVRHRARDAAHQVADAGRRHGTLHRPKIHRPCAPPGDALHCHRVADRLHALDQGHEHERGKKRPEHRPEVEVQAGPGGGREADPRGLGDGVHVVETEIERDEAARHHADHRRPEAHPGSPLQRGDDDDDQGHDCAQRGGQRRRAGRHVVQQPEGGWHQRGRDQHDDRARDGGRQDLAEQREPEGDRQRNQRRDEHQGGEQR